MPNGRGGDLEEEGGGASRKRPRPGLSVQDARISVEAHSPGVEESRSVLEPVSISFAMKCNASTLGGRTTALEAALRKVATDFGGLAFRLERTRVGPSDDTLQRVLPLLLGLVGPQAVWPCFQTCRAWRREMETRGFCPRTWLLCSTLASQDRAAGDSEDPSRTGQNRVAVRLAQSALRRLDAFSPGGLSTDASTLPAEHAVRLHASNAFLQRWRNGFQLRSAGCVVDGGLAGCNGSLHEWLQAASQEPDASFLSRGAASTADMLGLPLLRWAAKPQGRYRGVRTLSLHSECVRSVAFSPDGNWIVSGSGDRLIKIWTAATGAEVRTLAGHAGEINSVAFSPDGKWIVSGSDDCLVKIWNAATGVEVCTLTGHSGEINSVSFFPDGKRVVSGSSDLLVKIWDVATGAEIWSSARHDCSDKCLCAMEINVYGDDAVTVHPECPVTGHAGEVFSVVVSPDGTRVVSGSTDSLVKCWNAETGTEVWTSTSHDCTGACICTTKHNRDVHPQCPVTGHSQWVTAVAVSPDGKWIVTGSGDYLVKIWDTATGAVVGTLRGHSFTVSSVAFSLDGTRVVSGSYDSLITIWDPATRAEVCTLAGQRPGHGITGKVLSVDFSPDGKRVVSGSDDNLVKIWANEERDEALTRKWHSNEVYSVAFSPDGLCVVSGSHDKLVKLWNAATGAEVRTLRGHTGAVTYVEFLPDGTRVVSALWDSTIRIWNAATGAAVFTLRGHVGEIETVSLSPDGNRIVSGGDDCLVKIWNAATGAEVFTLTGHEDMVSSVAFSSDGTRIVSGSNDTLVMIWNAETGAEVCTLAGHSDSVNSVSFSPDTKWVVTGSDDCLVKIWNAETGAEVWTTTSHNCYFPCICSMANNEWGRERVMVHRDCLVTGHSGMVTKVRFCQDGKSVVSGSVDDTVRFWDMASGEEVRQVAGQAFSFAEGPEGRGGQYLLSVSGLDTVLITALPPLEERHWSPLSRGGPVERDSDSDSDARGRQSHEAPRRTPAVACFKAPQAVTSAQWHGGSICVGDSSGPVCILQAPFLAA